MLTSASEEKTRDFLARLLAQPASGFIVVAERDGAIVGLAAAYFTISGVLAERLVHLGDLFVAPAHRRHGIATALVREVARQGRVHHIPLVRWLSLATNTDLNAWYASLGASTGDFKLFLLPTQEPAASG